MKKTLNIIRLNNRLPVLKTVLSNLKYNHVVWVSFGNDDYENILRNEIEERIKDFEYPERETLEKLNIEYLIWNSEDELSGNNFVQFKDQIKSLTTEETILVIDNFSNFDGQLFDLLELESRYIECLITVSVFV